MDELQDHEFYLQKALEAEKRALDADEVTRSGWLFLAQEYRRFAEQLRPAQMLH
ncbi:MAG TPA: hypothetical protein VG501_01765 [Rhizomicrobium sp.]|nr:hypothetical protein [Rhizomicrobium sp.]